MASGRARPRCSSSLDAVESRPETFVERNSRSDGAPESRATRFGVLVRVEHQAQSQSGRIQLGRDVVVAGFALFREVVTEQATGSSELQGEPWRQELFELEFERDVETRGRSLGGGRPTGSLGLLALP